MPQTESLRCLLLLKPLSSPTFNIVCAYGVHLPRHSASSESLEIMAKYKLLRKLLFLAPICGNSGKGRKWADVEQPFSNRLHTIVSLCVQNTGLEKQSSSPHTEWDVLWSFTMSIYWSTLTRHHYNLLSSLMRQSFTTTLSSLYSVSSLSTGNYIATWYWPGHWLLWSWFGVKYNPQTSCVNSQAKQ